MMSVRPSDDKDPRPWPPCPKCGSRERSAVDNYCVYCQCYFTEDGQFIRYRTPEEIKPSWEIPGYGVIAVAAREYEEFRADAEKWREIRRMLARHDVRDAAHVVRLLDEAEKEAREECARAERLAEALSTGKSL